VRRLLLVPALLVAAVAPLASAAPRYDRPCTGKVDFRCHYAFCGIADCTIWDCRVFLDPGEGYNTGWCPGGTVRDGGVES
jgi:hypothetical protein